MVLTVWGSLALADFHCTNISILGLFQADTLLLAIKPGYKC